MIQGKDILVYIEKDGKYIATACDKSCTLDINSDFLKITNPEGSNLPRRLPIGFDWSIRGNGLVDYRRKISALFMQQSILLGTRVHVRFYAKAAEGYAVYSGYGYFQSISETGDVNGMASYQYVIVADSDLTVESSVPQDENENNLVGLLATEDKNLIVNGENEPLIIK